ncbi:HAD-IIB family hydrolase [Parasphingorhabdus sp. DH2-15]|uniref:HAD-IIB family hydrolase n=1 Tax=Parasphingorhabdus sp. DH2-15 TaxID=3444112 RepID=UPI003F6856B6
MQTGPANILPLIFTDLDGTLLDHHNYSSSPADRLIAGLEAHNIAQIIPVTSKTRSELQALRKDIPLNYAVGVTENGSVIDDVSGIIGNDAGTHGTPHMHILGLSYADILSAIATLPHDIRQHITGFSDMSVTDIAQSTGLSLESAKRAGKREASEPFSWSGSDQQMAALTAHMEAANIRVQRGGRFFHLTGHATKEMAMARIAAAFADRAPDRDIVTIALGDGPNDLAMIKAADHGVIMPNPDGVTISANGPHMHIAPHPGPKGWNAAVQNILSELGFNLSES